jgi:hypothetical protein
MAALPYGAAINGSPREVAVGPMLSKKNFEGVSEQYRFKASAESERSIQGVSGLDSIVARRSPAADFFDSIGQQPTSCRK